MISGVTMKINVDDYIINTLKEDITSEDVSTNAVMPENKQGKADLICKQDGIICGLDVFERTFKILDEASCFEANAKDGDFVHKGDLLGVIYGDIKVILSGERTALNYLQRMSGIATITREYAEELKGCKTVLLDTRKTMPNMRPFEKHAVKVGGGTNHRYNLSDGVLLKDNHIGAAGSITKAIEMARAYAPFVRKIEIETETLEQIQEALDAGAEDFSEEEDSYEILTAPDAFDSVRTAIEAENIEMASAEVTMLPQTYVTLSDETDLKNIQRILDLLDEDDDVQDVYHNWDE